MGSPQVVDSNDVCAVAENSEANAHVSDALLGTRADELGPKVVLLAFSRSPHAFRMVFQQAPELESCRRALTMYNFALELESGTKMLVRPEHYNPTLEAIRLAGWHLSHQHVFVDVELEKVVIGLLQSLPGREKVHPRGVASVPLAFASATSSMEADVTISRTFVNIRVPSSMRSSDGTGLCTVSTTDADKRKGKNKRGKKQRKNFTNS